MDNNLLGSVFNRDREYDYEKFYRQIDERLQIPDEAVHYIPPSGILEFLGLHLPVIDFSMIPNLQAQLLALSKESEVEAAKQIQEFRLLMLRFARSEIRSRNLFSKKVISQAMGRKRKAISPQYYESLKQNIFRNVGTVQGRNSLIDAVALDRVYSYEWPKEIAKMGSMAGMSDLYLSLGENFRMSSLRLAKEYWKTVLREIKQQKGAKHAKVQTHTKENIRLLRETLDLSPKADFQDAEALHVAIHGIPRTNSRVIFTTADPPEVVAARGSILKSTSKHIVEYFSEGKRTLQFDHNFVGVFDRKSVKLTHIIPTNSFANLVEIPSNIDWYRTIEDLLLMSKVN